MVGVFVGDQDSIDILDILADLRQTFSDLAAAEPSIDENAGAVGRHKSGIAGTAAREDTDLKDGKLRLLFLSDTFLSDSYNTFCDRIG